MTSIEQGIIWFAVIALVSVIAAVGLRRDKVRKRRLAYIEAAMLRHPAGNRS